MDIDSAQEVALNNPNFQTLPALPPQTGTPDGGNFVGDPQPLDGGNFVSALIPTTPVSYAPQPAEEVAIPPSPEKVRLSEEINALMHRLSFVEHEARTVHDNEMAAWQQTARNYEREARDIIHAEVSQQTMRLTDQSNSRVTNYESQVSLKVRQNPCNVLGAHWRQRQLARSATCHHAQRFM